VCCFTFCVYVGGVGFYAGGGGEPLVLMMVVVVVCCVGVGFDAVAVIVFMLLQLCFVFVLNINDIRTYESEEIIIKNKIKINKQTNRNKGSRQLFCHSSTAKQH
jgi:hypothetical protein